MYAVIRSGGKQQRVRVGEVVRVERLPVEVGSAVVFDQVALVADGDAVRIGAPDIEGARVRATVLEQGRGPKILVYTFKKRKNANRKRRGHRQDFTAVRIDAIEA